MPSGEGCIRAKIHTNSLKPTLPPLLLDEANHDAERPTQELQSGPWERPITLLRDPQRGSNVAPGEANHDTSTATETPIMITKNIQITIVMH